MISDFHDPFMQEQKDAGRGRVPGWRAPHQREDLVRYDSAPETFLYDAPGDVVHVLNPTALAVWELCDGAHTPEQMARYLETRFAGVPAGAADEAVREALAAFEQKALIHWPTNDKEGWDGRGIRGGIQR